jgi:hypothetical protein
MEFADFNRRTIMQNLIENLDDATAIRVLRTFPGGSRLTAKVSMTTSGRSPEFGRASTLCCTSWSRVNSRMPVDEP